MPTLSSVSSSPSRRRLLRFLAVSGFAFLCAAASGAQQSLVNGNASYSFANQSMWGSGGAFQFDYTQFVGVDVDPAAFTVGAGSSDKISVPTFLGTYSLNPYFQFDSDFKLGVELGASINSGSVDGNLDYGVSLSAPDQIQVGQAFSLTGSATALGSSSFTTRSPQASAWVDGILEIAVDGYARLDYVAPGALKDHDFRWGNKGFTDNVTSNTPYNRFIDINKRQQLIGINRNQSGVVEYFAPTGDLFDGDLLFDKVGKGSSVSAGPVTLTAGNIDVVANGSLVGTSVIGAGQNTLASMVLDVDHMLLGTPALGLSLGHDWGIVDYSLGYEVVDLDAGLDILFQQDFLMDSQVLIDLVFSSDVLVGGVMMNHYVGAIDQIPLLTLLDSFVDVDATLFVEAFLSNDTSLGFVGSLNETLLEAWASVGYDVGGKTGTAGYQVGPVYDATQQIGLGNISVYNNTFSLGTASIGSWNFSLVPEPGTAWLLASGLLGLILFGRGHRQTRERA
ncbi:MAG: hypothetical protein JRH01_13700 [Deltaproteobacteria bacterium]|nr:hypothetical protein [Deltaproteobacteria bacterium]MBW2394952.1 hypothetical protein [Deltaproteobacteria bacterium]